MSFKKLELDKILILLAEEAVSDFSKEKILALKPSYDKNEVLRELRKTDDAFTLSAKFGSPRFYKIKNLTDNVKRAKSGGVLSLRELLDTLAILRQINGLVIWYKQCENIENLLGEYFDSLIPNKNLESVIENSVLSEEELSDNASPELSRIRKAINRKGISIRESLDKLLRNQDKQKFLQESIVTTRDGRYVVPVKAEYKNEIGGLVHDTSSSGATFFIEPMNVVEANNEIRVLKGKEQIEIERIIRELSKQVGEFSDDFISGYNGAVELEIYFAKASLGEKMKASTPKITEKPYINFIKARHPLIDKQKVVPINISLGETYDCLIVTGPNTGGKTVAIKTAGLLVLMAQCGLMIPVGSGSKMGVFTKILADVGDEQSIEQSLSTFSSHMNNIIKIMKIADEKSLVLLDELGSGTDPVEGAALAVTIINFLKEKGSKLIATTHYQEVKIFAIETDGVENASCEFDVTTLMPTYKLIVGFPGKSNAFAIAKRLGLDENVIRNANDLVSHENRRFENVVESLEAARKELERIKADAVGERQRSIELRKNYDKKLSDLEKSKERELDKARNKSLSIINEVRFYGDKLISELEELKHQKDKEDFSERVKNSRTKLKKQLDKLHDKANPVEKKEVKEYTLPRSLKIYDTVRLMDIDKKGTLIKEPDKSGNCLVQIGIIKTKTKIQNLELILEPEEVKLNNIPISSLQVESNMTKKTSMELDIRGNSAHEGVLAVDHYLDSAILSGLHVVTIIHGKGTGVLRDAVHQLLKSHKHVDNFRLGVYGEGDAGVTVVEIKQ